ncbi:MAG: LamG-like jellyroll fold domain-containing protein, partial [Verrucomicrobiota bacterium]
WVRVPALSATNTCVYLRWGGTNTNRPAYTTNGATWSRDYEAVWHLSDASNLVDSTEHRWDGTGSGTLDVPGVIGRAQDFDGSAFIHAGPGIDLANKSFTVSAWARRESTGADNFLVSHGVNSAGSGLHFGFRGNNNFTFAFWSNDLDAPSLNDTTDWHLWTGVYDASAGEQILYRDGIEFGRRSASAYVGNPNTVLRIGERFGDSRHNGEIDEVRIVGNTISSNWIRAVWMNSASNEAFNCFEAPPLEDIDLAVAKSVDTPSLVTGTNLTYTLTVSNLSLSVAAGVVVTDALPANVSFVSAVPAPDTVAPGLLTWELGSLEAGSNAVITLQTTVDTGAMNALTNHVFVYSDNTDTNAANDTAMAVTTLPDFDGDGLRDFVDPDDDNDGVSDEEEAIADTDPADPDSFLWVTIQRTPMSAIQRIQFPSSSNRIYFIQARTNLFNGGWETIRTNIPGTGAIMDVPESTPHALRYYRVGVKP